MVVYHLLIVNRFVRIIRRMQGETERFEMRAPKDWLAAIDEWRRKQSAIPSRAAAIRALVEAGLRALTEKQRAA